MLTDRVNKHGVGTLLSHIVIYRGSIICYSDHLSKIGAQVCKEIIEFVSNALFTDNVLIPLHSKWLASLDVLVFVLITAFSISMCF